MRQITQANLFPFKINYTRMPLAVLGFLMAVGCLLVITIFGLLTYQIYFLDRAYLGIQVDGVEVGALNRFEVQQLVMAQTNQRLNRRITIVGQEATWVLTAAELGATIDVEKIVDDVFSLGRQGKFSGDLSVQLRAMDQPVVIKPEIHYDTGPTNAFLARLIETYDRPTRDAQLYITSDLQVIAEAAQAGQRVDVEAMRQAIEAAVLADQDTTISLQIITTQPQITEVEPARSHVATFLSQPITFSFEDRRWTLEPAFLAALISFQPDGQGQMVAYFDTEPLEAYFQELAPQLDRQPINAWFELDETTWALNPTVASQDGYALDVQTAVDLVADQIRQPGSHQLNLPVTTISPAVPMANPEQLGIKELVSTNTSYFKGSSKERIQNIATAAAKFDGLVIPPGEIFSFNEHLGDVSPENGFAESLIIAGDRTAVGIGGGVCQVSTTAFRAAFYGGFEIVERWAHGYRVSWYEIGSTPGLDATIYSPLVDLKFRNDTDSYILIQTETDASAGTLTFDFYGTSANREVIVSEPIEENNVPHGPAIYEKTSDLESGEVKQVDWAVDGIDVTVTRTVKHGDQIIHQDTIFSRYRPWQAVYRVGL